MAFYGRRYRRYRRYKRFYRRFGGRRRGYARRYVNASSKSNVRIRTSIDKVVSLPSGDSSGPGFVNTTNCFGPYDPSSPGSTVIASPLYRTYCNLYEEVKCVGMKISVAVNSVVGNATLPSLQIFTAWDRRHGSTEAAWTAAEIKNSSSYNVSTAVNNNVAKITRSLFASDLMEKAQWHDCSLDEAVDGTFSDLAYTAAALNPNFFSPAFFICLQSPTLGASTTVSLSLSVTYYMAFRNPKYGGGSSAAKASYASAAALPFDDGDIDDGGDMDDVPPPAAESSAGPARVARSAPINVVDTGIGDTDAAVSSHASDRASRSRTIRVVAAAARRAPPDAPLN